MDTVRTGRMWNGEAKAARKLKDGSRYLHLFPRADLKDTLIKRQADVKDTIGFIPKAVRLTKDQVRAFVQSELSGYSLMETCRRIWQFLYDHIGYKKDDPGKEQIRSPARTMHDRVADCDDYATFISAILSVKKIPHFLRVTKYSGSWQHIYVIVPVAGARYITLDCVVDRFNYEVPFTDKIDVKMDLEFLSGFDSASKQGGEYSILPYRPYDINGLGGNDFAELGKLINKAKLKTAVKKVAKTGGKVIKTAGKIAKEGLHVINRINPATVLLRNGILASMKLNVMNVAGRLKWAYLNDAQARQKGINPVKLAHLKTVMSKLEKIYYGAGGKASNLKNAILKGKGNARKEVSGLGLVDWQDIAVDGLAASLPISELLGIEMYLDENRDYLSGLRGQSLGEPATAAALTAASGVMATIAAAIKKIGNIFNGKQHPDFPEDDKTPLPDTSSPGTGSGTKQENPSSEMPVTPPDAPEDEEPETSESPETPQAPAGSEQLQPKDLPANTNSAAANTDNKEKSFMEKYGTTIKVLGGVTVATGLIAVLVSMGKKESKPHKQKSLSGAPVKKVSKKIRAVPLD